MGDNWQCPFCQHFQVLSTSNYRSTSGIIGSDRNKYGITVGKIIGIECMNGDCREISISAELGECYKIGEISKPSILGKKVLKFKIRPTSIAKPQHNSVPSVLVADYEEACAILTASPKASATLSRRCLQGMIRDFCSISKGTLSAEIIELERKVQDNSAPRQVSEESIAAIDAVRGIGNIGAHFERDINTIIPVEIHEAEALIHLIELLFREWYVARDQRQQMLQGVKKIAGEKKELRASS